MSLAIVLAVACLSLLQLGNGQPTRPELSESFSTSVTSVAVGTKVSAKVYRNYEEGLQRQVEQLGVGNTVDGTINVIISVKGKKEYEYFEPYDYCAVISVPSVKLMPQWAFVKEAKYKGETTFNGTKVDIWTYNDTKTNVYYELGVSTDIPKVPVFLFEDMSGFAISISIFESYTSGPPDASVFEVPSICKEKPAWFHRDSPARNYSSITAFGNIVH